MANPKDPRQPAGSLDSFEVSPEEGPAVATLSRAAKLPSQDGKEMTDLFSGFVDDDANAGTPAARAGKKK